MPASRRFSPRPLARWFTAACVALCCGVSLSMAAPADAADDAPQRWNVLWIIAEDMGVEVGCYGEPLVHTPHIDGLARDGVRYTHCFTTAPVCSAARSALMTGMYQTSIGAHNHRSHRDDGHQLPAGVRLLSHRFRDAGYYTANLRTGVPGCKGTGKTDWNFNLKAGEKPFDGDDFGELKSHQPFFAQINFSETHRNFKRSPEHPVDPAKVKLPPYYPDHPTTRRDWADYLETVNVLDTHVGQVLAQLQKEGLAENTVVIFFADHGRAHVRGKQWLYDGGIHVPLIVRFPDRRQAGKVDDRLVNQIDISAASLGLAGIARPKTFEGISFLDPDSRPREYVVSARDRCDETFDRIRSVRDARYKYIRNFHPERPYTQINRYKLKQYPVLTLLHELHKQGKLTPAQELFMAERRPEEELYDMTADPHEIHNLAGSAEHAAVLKAMRGRLDDWVRTTDDQGQTPEPQEILDFWERRQAANYKIPKK